MQELPIHCIVEGLVDEAAVRKLFSELSLAAGAFYHTSIPAFGGSTFGGSGVRTDDERVRA